MASWVLESRELVAEWPGPPHITKPQYDALPLVPEEDKVGYKSYVLPWYAPGLQVWWVLQCFVIPLCVQPSASASGKFVLDSWARWCLWAGEFFSLN